MNEKLKPDTGQKTNIPAEILQQVLDSAKNAAEKGLSSYYTPLELAQKLTAALPRLRATAVDLNCGAGALLQACVTKDTFALLGSDIDPHRPKIEGCEKPFHLDRIAHDTTKLYGLLKEVQFSADLFVLNPPWRLWWYRDRLDELAHSELMSVRDAFAGIEASAPRGCIDSTAATLLMALDLCTTHGEGYLIGNNSTIERLFFAPGAPHAAVAKHIWSHIVIPGNPMTGIDEALWEKYDATKPITPFNKPFETGVIYFARDHTTGTKKYQWPQLPDRAFRMGAELRVLQRVNDPRDAWTAAKERVAELNGKESRMPYNLWLNAGGRIRVGLSQFEQRSTKLNKKEAERLHQLDGKAPMELVLQRAQRDELLHVCERGGWKVQSELTAAIQRAVKDYHGSRAPLYPLPEIQRLGYLDEQDTIECKEDLMGFAPSEEQGASSKEQVKGRGKKPLAPSSLILAPTLIWRKGHKYSLRTQTVIVTRNVEKPDPFTGRKVLLEFTGQELAILIADCVIDPTDKDRKVREYCFMDNKLKEDPTVECNLAKRTNSRGNEKFEAGEKQGVDFTLQQLAAHFIIPEVPDVAAVNPEQYAVNLDKLTDLETTFNQLCAA
jgi:predicted RNA methylase